MYYSLRLAAAVKQNLPLLVALRIGRKRRAAVRVRWFFAMTGRVRKLRYMSKRIMWAARTLQRGVRDFRACTAARLDVLRLLWLRAEDHARARQHRRRKKRVDDIPMAGRSDFGGALAILKNDEPWDTVTEKLDDVRSRLVNLRVLDHAPGGRVSKKRLRDVSAAKNAPARGPRPALASNSDDRSSRRRSAHHPSPPRSPRTIHVAPRGGAATRPRTHRYLERRLAALFRRGRGGGDRRRGPPGRRRVVDVGL